MDRLIEKYLCETKYTIYWKKKNEKKFRSAVELNSYTDRDIMKYQSQIAMDNQLPKGNINIIVVDNSKNKVVAHEFNLPGEKHSSYEKELEKAKKIVNKDGFTWK
jgi:hypothetical protein